MTKKVCAGEGQCLAGRPRVGRRRRKAGEGGHGVINREVYRLRGAPSRRRLADHYRVESGSAMNGKRGIFSPRGTPAPLLPS